ncbi:enoyl-CoA hydratase/isomerase family protein [Sphingobium sp. 3R8]|uniref:enoyl-CoA hydratase/isomerase family protein n=1 Tax=Sphingobium sp. 3R8 TaxID=2874921 RepID=UPI001CCBDFC6|nr:enoyl-CoA hydratase-related protein [Sphingobium sp. 3R8]MBZ9646878.1 enoyl-CoA hydratase/isomerase family protein [Sphingobium sp. 3R8]
MSEYDYKHLLVVEDGPILRVTLNRPEIHNALNDRLVDELNHMFTLLHSRADLRVVVLAANGRNFCAGLDLTERTGALADTGTAIVEQRRISRIVLSMRSCPQPIVALVQGAASGGGMALALAADVRVATSAARMNAAFIRVGLSACDIGVSYFLPRMVGASVASEYMLTGRFIDAERGRHLGLFARVVEPDQLSAEGESFVRDMLHATPLGLRLTKEALKHAIDAPGLEAVIALEDRNQVLCAQSSDFAEGIAAFREKRVPRYDTVPGVAHRG